MQPAPLKPVIVCADDFAASESVSLGIVQLAALGQISATSAMVLSPRWSGDAARLLDLAGRLGVGLHLDWTSPFAIAAGHGMPLGKAMLSSLLGGFAAGQARVVVERQLDAFEAHWKGPPDHVDGHQHVQQFRGIRGALLEVLDRRYGRGLGPYLRISRPLHGGVKGAVVASMGAAALGRQLEQRGRRGSPILAGIYDFGGSELDYAGRVDGWLREAPAGTILMCHPAMAADGDDAIGVARLREFGFWSGAAASAALARAGAVLARGPAPIPCAR